ncbi:Gfo/Idh/MocA family protein [Tengunoibacter tsumagoiensis]|uniref:Oxidoreductase n=1 Tax=Tengunoibacter tsumagoiensis TaxID=2014871 RepID=A0A402A1C8_9CHLR|nr:Gfo/Idh/MocA family oxidoreductase [Tengunoibacter tsumagoiensis]GCE12875.1 oxidoreductase [Tengunoibacter tsumagoiensis]
MQQGKKVRTVLVGCGGMSRAWLNAVQELPEVEMVGLVDIYESAANQRASEYNLMNALIATNLETIFAQTEVDAVFNCTIPEAHYEITMSALKHGCHVLSEKPLANSLKEAQEMVAAAQQAGKIFSVIQNRRYDADIRRVTQFLRSDAIGPLTTINSDFYIGAHFGGFRDQMKHVLLLDMAIHTFDAARLLIGADPVSVYCKEWNPSGSWYAHDASAIAIFEMSNGAVYTYRGSWCAEGLPTSWECDWRFIGQQGSVTWDGHTQVRAQAVAETGGFTSQYQDLEIPAYTTGNIGGHAGLIHEFFAAIQNGTQPETQAADNIKSLAMVFGAIESSESGVPVPIQL